MRTLLALLVLAGCAEPPPLTVGQQVDGTLTADDEHIHSGAAVDMLRVHVGAGEAAAIIVTSEDVAPFLIVGAAGDPWGAASGVAAGPGACVTVTARAPLDVLVYVSSAGGAGYGGYRLAVAPFSHALAGLHGCEIGGPDDHPSDSGPTFTAGSTATGDHARPSAV